jgi:hypothetical protein
VRRGIASPSASSYSCVRASSATSFMPQRGSRTLAPGMEFLLICDVSIALLSCGCPPDRTASIQDSRDFTGWLMNRWPARRGGDSAGLGGFRAGPGMALDYLYSPSLVYFRNRPFRGSGCSTASRSYRPSARTGAGPGTAAGRVVDAGP